MIKIDKQDPISFISESLKLDLNFKEYILSYLESKPNYDQKVYYNTFTDKLVSVPSPGETLAIFSDSYKAIDIPSIFEQFNSRSKRYTSIIFDDNQEDSQSRLIELVIKGEIPIQYINNKQFYELILMSNEELSEAVIEVGYNNNDQELIINFFKLISTILESEESIRTINLIIWT